MPDNERGDFYDENDLLSDEWHVPAECVEPWWHKPHASGAFYCHKHNRPFYLGAPEKEDDFIDNKHIQSVSYPNARCLECSQEATHAASHL